MDYVCAICGKPIPQNRIHFDIFSGDAAGPNTNNKQHTKICSEDCLNERMRNYIYYCENFIEDNPIIEITAMMLIEEEK